MRLPILHAFAVIALLLPAAQGALIHDGFEDSALGNVHGQNGGVGWSGAWAVATQDDITATVVTPTTPLDYQGGVVQVKGGSNALQLTATGTDTAEALRRDFASHNGEFYMSFLYRHGSTIETDEFAQFGLDSGQTNPRVSTGVARSATSPNRYRLFARSGTKAEDSPFVTPNLAADETYFVVMRISKTSGTNYNSAEVWVNPTTLLLDDSSPNYAQSTADSSISSVDRFLGRFARLQEGDTFLIDEIRMGTSFSDVVPVPEPSSLLLLGLGLAGLTAVAWRRRQVLQR